MRQPAFDWSNDDDTNGIGNQRGTSLAIGSDRQAGIGDDEHVAIAGANAVAVGRGTDTGTQVVASRQVIDEYSGKKLDASGHFWWAAYCRHKQEYCIGMAARDPQHAQDWAEVARTYKDGATRHEARGNAMSA